MMSKKDGSGQENRNIQTSRTELSSNMDFAPDTQLPVDPSGVIVQKAQLLMWLVISSPIEHRGMVLPVADGAIIGRNGDMVWHDARMSRKHARFSRITDPENRDGTVFAIEPIKDRNGTTVNGRKIKQVTRLRENDVIVMGNTRFIVKVLE